jgi:hypothetical protein
MYRFFDETCTASGIKLSDKKAGHLFFREPPVLPGTEPPKPKKGKSKKAKTPPVKPKLRIQVGPRNDWWFVKESVKKFGLNLFILGDRIVIADSAKWLKDKQAAGGGTKYFLLHGEVDPNRSMFPILQFSSPTTAVWLNPGMGKWVSKDIDREKKKVESETTKDNTPFAIVGGQTTRDPDAKTHTNKDAQTAAANMPGDPSNQAVIEQAKGEWKTMQMQGGITVSVTSLGIPSLAPGEVVHMYGFEERGALKDPKTNIFNGAYGVTEVRHSVGVGGFQTRFTAISNFYPAAFADATKNPGQSEVQKPLPIPVSLAGLIKVAAAILKKPKGECD